MAAEIRATAAREQLRAGDLAEVAGLPASTVSKLLNGAMPFDVDQLSKIAAALQLESSTLMQRAEHSLAAKRGRVIRPDVGAQGSDDPV